ncbi:AraC family transcriptional regulator [Anaerosporobacter sp.]|uniref:AraC family transcriptional regulator n=1 Tax=Anaerosporobacter sp. TaxID=1872529 RepID=UPI00286F489A|nr:AraC family transcriptional regulator [Anaerosporobacter sp.]
MKKNLRTEFTRRQYMLSKDFEIYYYNDRNLMQVKPHTHNYYEFYFFLEGEVSIKIEEETYALKAGDIVLIPPNVYHHAIIHDKSKPYRRFVLWISKEYCEQLMEMSIDYVYLMQYVSISKEYIFHNDIITFNTIQAKVFQLVEEIQGERFGKNIKITLSINDLILHLNRIVYEWKQERRLIEGQNLYQNLIYYIDEHLDEKLTLDTLAKEFFISKYHIAHIFKDNMGLSIHQYILKKRLLACKEAMFGNESISEIYLLFGFKDYSSFYRAFKKEFGVSPKEFKEMKMHENV